MTKTEKTTAEHTAYAAEARRLWCFVHDYGMMSAWALLDGHAAHALELAQKMEQAHIEGQQLARDFDL